MSQKLPLGVEIRLLEVFFSSSFKTVIAEADLSWRILESGLRLTNIADAHRSFTFLASLCLCFFSSFWAKNKINSLISPLFKHFALHPEQCHEGRKRHLRRPHFSKGLIKLAILPDYECPGLICLALPARRNLA